MAILLVLFFEFGHPLLQSLVATREVRLDGGGVRQTVDNRVGSPEDEQHGERGRPAGRLWPCSGGDCRFSFCRAWKTSLVAGEDRAGQESSWRVVVKRMKRIKVIADAED